MTQCPGCFKEIEQDAKHCQWCGIALNVTHHCVRCSKEFTGTGKFCPFCGAPQPHQQAYSAPVAIIKEHHSSPSPGGETPQHEVNSTTYAIKGAVCPSCGSDVYSNNYSLWHVLACILTFPIGLLVFLAPIKHCRNCQHDYGAGKPIITFLQVAIILIVIGIGISIMVLMGLFSEKPSSKSSSYTPTSDQSSTYSPSSNQQPSYNYNTNSSSNDSSNAYSNNSSSTTQEPTAALTVPQSTDDQGKSPTNAYDSSSSSYTLNAEIINVVNKNYTLIDNKDLLGAYDLRSYRVKSKSSYEGFKANWSTNKSIKVDDAKIVNSGGTWAKVYVKLQSTDKASSKKERTAIYEGIISLIYENGNWKIDDAAIGKTEDLYTTSSPSTTIFPEPKPAQEEPRTSPEPSLQEDPSKENNKNSEPAMPTDVKAE